jgi:hypothetical protein
MRKRSIGRVLGFLLLLLGSACLEVDGQDLVIRVDPANDRIDLLLVHRGLFAAARSGVDGEPLPRALRDLDAVADTGRLVLWHDRLLSLDPCAEHAPAIADLLAHVDVENGGLFTDPQGVLCAYQFVRVRDARRCLDALDVQLARALADAMRNGLDLGDGRHRFDDDSRQLLAERLRNGERLLRVEPGRLELRLPLSPRDHAWAKAQLAKLLLRQLPYDLVVGHARASGDAAPRSAAACEPLAGHTLPAAALPELLAHAASLRFFIANDVAVVRSRGQTSLVVGSGEAGDLTLHKPAHGVHDHALTAALRARGTPIEAGVPDAELHRRFFAFGAREAVLPPALAARRPRANPPPLAR